MKPVVPFRQKTMAESDERDKVRKTLRSFHFVSWVQTKLKLDLGLIASELS